MIDRVRMLNLRNVQIANQMSVEIHERGLDK